jgi:hypothetical protein
MPRQTPTLFQKIRMSYWYVTNKKGFGLIECCGVCGSTKITEKNIREKNGVYHSKFRCNHCGAVARVKEKWRS